MIGKLLDLSTGHVCRESADLSLLEPDFGRMRYEGHDHGWVVFVSPSIDPKLVPDWLKPIHTKAVAEDCMLILFDEDGAMDADFEIFQW